MTMTTSATVSSSVNSNILHGRANRVGAVRDDAEQSTVGGIEARNSGKQRHDAVHGLDDVGAGLPANADDHGRLAVGIRADCARLRSPSVTFAMSLSRTGAPFR